MPGLADSHALLHVVAAGLQGFDQLLVARHRVGLRADADGVQAGGVSGVAAAEAGAVDLQAELFHFRLQLVGGGELVDD